MRLEQRHLRADTHLAMPRHEVLTLRSEPLSGRLREPDTLRPDFLASWALKTGNVTIAYNDSMMLEGKTYHFSTEIGSRLVGSL